ncbi:MAG: valine--tRNA ligase [Candidatus Tagabacteria bacterium CG03_land_8_20_14_0_80_41_22]|uniref:valine--tRNA ligase n=1 Tax=Candidatus Tagabacteria bacterium CG03_land_8_20_14_0_80_41_22 TaxID=1975020 RepID=A0A2M7B8S5_9BACT|nr:MAG: valine--tRNA ligase [Candidatus Tagabacteria bacterium CG03_land_8_20_14_0_80_41_22]
MSKELDKAYEPKKVESRIYEMWEKSGFFQPEADRSWADNPNKKKTYTIVIPPPNITGSLHMGHVLNATIQDILIRKKRMEGYQALWVPGTDHAGIATQNAVEKDLKKQGLSRYDIGREEFLNRVWQWKEKYGNQILEQLKKIGASCDWSRLRFTMDNAYQLEVEKAFFHYYKKGWIYRGEKVVNWCSRCQTSLSDLELEYKKETAKLYFIKYPLENGSLPSGEACFITVATTRPETMLGDSAVAIHPSDVRYKNLIGQCAILPLTDRKIPIISDRRVEAEFGTGAVKVTPAHSIIDSEIGQGHNLEFFKIIGEHGKMLPLAGKAYAGLSIADCRTKVVEDLEKQNLIEKIEDYEHNIAHCYRCGSVVENLPSLQWFLKMDELAKMAIKAVKSGKVKFHPSRWEKIYLDWLKNIKDWCISRQIWWGHKIPIEGVEDVLDTWFSSALWPFAIFENKKDLKKFYPTNTLVTARDIINFWVARMVFSGLEFMKKAPFHDVLIHATILTSEGKRMSKSLGTGLDPMNFIEQYGADATRFALIWQTMGTQDVHWSVDALVAGKKFLNKIWNASRFVLQQTENSKSEYRNPKQIQNSKFKIPKPKTQADKEILKKLKEITKNTSKNIDNFEFSQALHDLYDFFWHDFCDCYLESSKAQMANADLKENTQKILIYVLSNSLKLLHPFIPHVTEEIWSKMSFFAKALKDKSTMLIIEKWPTQ